MQRDASLVQIITFLISVDFPTKLIFEQNLRNWGTKTLIIYLDIEVANDGIYLLLSFTKDKEISR